MICGTTMHSTFCYLRSFLLSYPPYALGSLALIGRLCEGGRNRLTACTVCITGGWDPVESEVER